MPEVGQLYADRDRFFDGRVVEVTAVDGDVIHVVVVEHPSSWNIGRKSKIRADNIRRRFTLLP